MTPTEYLAQIQELVKSSQHEALAELVRAQQPAMLPLLTYDQLVDVACAMEIAELIVPRDRPPSGANIDASAGRT